MSDVTYRIRGEKKAWKASAKESGQLQLLETVSFSPSGDFSPSLQKLSGQVRSTPVNSGEVELEWLEIPASPVTERQPDVREDTSVLIPASQDADVPDSSVAEIAHEPETPVESSSPVANPSQRPRRERREREFYVRTVVC